MQPVLLVVCMLLFVAVFILITYVFPQHTLIIAIWAALFIVWLYFAFQKPLKGKIFWRTASAIIIVNIFLTNVVYTTLLNYQLGSHAGRYIHTHNIPAADVAIYKVNDPLNSLDFYARDTIRGIDTSTDLIGCKYLLIMDQGLAELNANNSPYDIVFQGQAFKVSELTPEFLNPKTRSKEVKNYYLVKLR